MSTSPQQPTKRDVFIVFSKSEPFEAKFALAVKHGLEELGRFAHEYEDWSWVERAIVPDGRAPEVDRAVLCAMLNACSAVLVIPARDGRPSEGAALELQMLASLQLPVVLLRWALTYEEDEPGGLNVICRYQVHGTDPNDSWITGAGESIAELLWLACNIAELRNRHVPIGSMVLDALPAFGHEPLTSFKLRDGLVNEDDYMREPNLDALADKVTASATREQLRVLIEDWWAEAEPALRSLQDDGHGPIRRPCRALLEAMQRIVERSRRLFPALESLSTDALLRRGTMLARFNDTDEAVALLTRAIARGGDLMHRLHAARALALHAGGDLDSAVAAMDEAVRLAPDKSYEVVHRFTRAVLRAKRGTSEAFRAAINDYTHILESKPDVNLRLSALNYRALHFASIGEVAAAIADWTQVIERQADHPRAAAQARFNRGVQYEKLGKLEDTRDDFTAVLAWADVSSSQRFRALEGRARVLERLGAPAEAADNIEAMLAMNMADPEWRPELQAKVRVLRGKAGQH